MKIFLDTANVDEIKKAMEYGVIDGITTNPSLIAREGKEFIPLVKEIVSIISGPVSVEVTAENFEEMIKEAEKYAKIAEIKIIGKFFELYSVNDTFTNNVAV